MILLVKKAKGPYKGLFDLPGGGIEFGESPPDAVVREVLEETGTAVAVEELVGAFSGVSTFVADTGTHLVELHHLGFLYRVHETAPSSIKSGPDGRDSLGALWLPLSEVRHGLISPLVTEGLRCVIGQA